MLPMIILCLFTFAGCDDAERHRWLTMFFDGVPPLGGEEEGVAVNPNAIYERRVRPEVVWYIHEPQKDCATCHGEKKKRTFSEAVQLVARPPELCYRCHDSVRNPQGRVHGPVAVEECLFCHDPHKSQNEHILKRAVPTICYQCHNQQAIALIEDHEKEYYAECLDCHVGHASERKYLLKEETAREASGISVEVGEPNSLAEAPLQ